MTDAAMGDAGSLFNMEDVKTTFDIYSEQEGSMGYFGAG